MSSYEEHCNDYAVHGDPMRDHYDYEEAAAYDRYDGWGDPDPMAAFEADYDVCPVCHGEDTCKACKDAIEDIARMEAEARADEAEYADDIPF